MGGKARVRRARKALVLLRRRSWRRAARRGVAAAVEHRNVPFGPEFASIIDVGAHHGQFSLVARALYPNADVMCVEPLPEAVERLRIIHAGDDRVTILPLAAAATDGMRSLHVSRKTDSSSLLPILGAHVEAFPGTEETRIVQVEARPLDAMFARPLRRPALLKIDVQGGELEVLTGATGLLAFVDAVYVECSFVELYGGQALAHDVINELSRGGFAVDGVFSVVRDDAGRCLQADFLFRPFESREDVAERAVTTPVPSSTRL